MGRCFSKSNPENTSSIYILSKSSATNFSPRFTETSQIRRPSKQKSPLFDPRLSLTSIEEQEIINGTEQKRALTKPELKNISQILSSHFVFNSLSSRSIQTLSQRFKIFDFDQSKTVFSLGHHGQNFYIVSSGSVEVLLYEERKAVIQKNGYFGEMALIYNSKRTATIKTIEKSCFFVLRGDLFRQAIHQISNERFRENKDFLYNLPFYHKLTEQQRDSLLSLMVVHEFEPGQHILREGEKGNLMYLIKIGQVVVLNNGEQLRVLGPGEYFGEQAALYKTLRTASVSAVNHVTLLSLDSKELINLLGSELEHVLYKNSLRISIEKCKVLSSLTKEQMENILGVTQIQKFEDGETIIKKGDVKGKSLIFVIKGEVFRKNVVYGKFDSISELSFVKDVEKEYKGTWKARFSTIIGEVAKEEVVKILGDPVLQTIRNNKILDVLKKVQVFRNISRSHLKLLISKLTVKSYSYGEVICQEGQIGEEFFIIKKGTVEIQINSKFIRQLLKHDFFGERSLLKTETRTASALSNNCKCWVLQKQDFLSLINKETRDYLLDRMSLQDSTSIQLPSLKLYKLLGKGTFGKVFLAHSQETSLFYALKTVSRDAITEPEVMTSLQQEKAILSQLDHPFIIKLISSFKDKSRVYFLLELAQGIDFFDLLRKFNSWDNEKARFYASCLVVILEYLHDRKIIYRDLKPENIVVEKDGYPKLIDFGLAKIVNGRTYSLAGTTHYMAPEVVQGMGYGLEADLWSLGVIIYEILCNRVPWGENENDPMEVYEMVVNSPVCFPSYIQNTYFKTLVEKLLNKNYALRGDVSSIKKHPWFASVDFDQLYEKQVVPPYKSAAEDYSKVLKNKGKDVQDFIKVFEGNFSKDYECEGDWEFDF